MTVPDLPTTPMPAAARLRHPRRPGRRGPRSAARLAVLAALGVGALALTACGGDSTTSAPAATVAVNPTFAPGTTMERLAKAGTVKVGTKFDQPLFGLRGPDGKPVGFDVEIAKIVAGALGIPAEKIQWVETVSANREPFIQNGQVDFVVATYTINDKRKEKVSFAGPYYEAGQQLMVRADDDCIKGPADLAGKKVCSVEGSTPAERIRTDYPAATLVPTDVYSNCLEPLRNKQVDALTTDNVILAGFVDQNEGDFKLVGEPFSKEPYGIGLKRDDDAFRTFIDDTLQKSFDDGTWESAWKATAGKILPTPSKPVIDRYTNK